ncbi:polysaccharide biosynthesis C-terminal domain-containing protein [Anaerococcus rubeinfantis]|uniref:polysaccharide biosynthesis C-terminal domain-containing protein n=1 Tax=Anaerococcus rubeinfantis TaxID=1720199 RepID=UPI00073E8375|nr:polysaccharide biosynthesis C-terminal domain-containing protein [Anaerococcus rubeinfantis]
MRSKKAFLNVLTNLILQVFIFVYGFVLPKIIISKYGSNVNGLISSVTQFLAYISLLESGVGPVVKSILYEPISQKDDKKITDILYATEKFFRTIAIIFIIYIVVLTFAYPYFIKTSKSTLYVSSLIIIISISIFSEYFFGMVYRIYLQANQETYVISIIQIGTYILAIIAAIIMARADVSVHILKLSVSLIFVLRPIAQNLYVKRKFNLDLKNANKNFIIKNKWDGLAQHIAYVVHTNTDITVLTIFSTLSEVSVYSVYMLIVKGVKALITAFSSGLDASFGDMISKKETENLRNKFELYEIIYFMICTVLFACSVVLIIPFVKIYTSNIHDADYIRPTFGILLVISECLWAIRLPYLTLVYAAGHFKETRKGAWVECITNIVISVILVRRYGIVGVAIGTIMAMIIRTSEFIYYANKKILKVNVVKSLKKIIELAVIIFLTAICAGKIFIFPNTSYIYWLINAIIVFVFASLLTFIFNMIFYRDKLMDVFEISKAILKRKSI